MPKSTTTLRNKYRSASWKRAPASARKRASARAKRVKHLSDAVDNVVMQALRLVDKNDFRRENGTKVVFLGIPDRVIELANRRKELVSEQVQVKKPPPLPPIHTWAGWGP